MLMYNMMCQCDESLAMFESYVRHNDDDILLGI